MSDNGPQFTSGVFKSYLKENSIRLVTGAPYHPVTNGLAERMAHSFKKAVKADMSGRTLQHKLDRFLLASISFSTTYQNWAQSSTNAFRSKYENTVGSDQT